MMVVQERVLGDRRKRSRTAAAAVIIPLDDDCEEGGGGAMSPRTLLTPAVAAVACGVSTHLVTDSSGTPTSSPASPPRSFLCPLTLSIMYDPVLDREGNSFERSALLGYLTDHTISPISRRPLHPQGIIPNHALRELIHQYMGTGWVRRKAASETNYRSRNAVLEAMGGLSAAAPPMCPYRSRMSRMLEALAPGDWGGDKRGSTALRLTLNSNGSAAFRCQGILVVLDVPRGVGLFHLYTRNLVLNPSPSVQRHMLELNFLQGTCVCMGKGCSGVSLTCGNLPRSPRAHLVYIHTVRTGETRGGCLSIKRLEDDGERPSSKAGSSSSQGSSEEVVFSYNDRVDEVGSRDVRNILLNFVETALSLKDTFEQMMMATTTESFTDDNDA
jgi:U-box domain